MDSLAIRVFFASNSWSSGVIFCLHELTKKGNLFSTELLEYFDNYD